MSNGITIYDAGDVFYTRLSDKFWLDSRTVSAGRSISGREQVISSPMPVWRATIAPVIVGETNRRWTAFMALLRGRTRAVRLSPYTGIELFTMQQRLGLAADWDGTGTLHSDNMPFSDNAGYEWPFAVFASNTSLDAGADTVNLHLNGHTATLAVGDWLGISGHLHIVTRILYPGPIDMVICIEPPLRIDLPGPSAPITTNPTAVFRLTTDDQGAATRYGGNPLQTPTVEIVELPEQV